MNLLAKAPPIGLPGGSADGDVVRYNAGTGAWEVRAEPLEFRGIVLTPALAALIDTEGSLYYNSGLKAVMVCTGT